MTKQQVIKSLESVIGKLVDLNYKIDGNELQTAMREVAYVRDKLQTNKIKIRKIK